MMYEKNSSYERTSIKLLNMSGKQKRVPFCRFRNGHLDVGTQSLHRTAAARMWRTFLRIKRVGR